MQWQLGKEHVLALQSVGLAGVSNAISAATTNPVDVLKVRMQLAGEGVAAQHMGIRQSAEKIFADEGARGFYRGITPSLLREMFYSGIRMGLYEPTKQAIGGTGSTSLAIKVLAGAITGATGSIIANPLDLIKVRMQSVTGTHTPYSSVLAAIREISREGGSVRSLWRGAGPTVQRASLLTASQVPSYDHMKHLIIDNNYMHDGYACHFLCCMGAGVIAAAVTSPIDLAKSRIMAQPIDQASGKGLLYRNTFHCLRRIVQIEGFLALFKGFNGQWLRIGPHTTISLMVFEQLRRMSGMQYL
eukprot:TRINITY_DN74703_c0_g1_i1.p1 TRINITY_DN74703_c0_g1~~TRINITY_DN74703_c0_g1_i1.p1  ORF type:complete len:301 (+),score=42.06 TRINITY_DN74703_c0_g1_i1:96-998(+)